MKVKSFIMLFIVFAFSSGCAIGPTWKSDVALPEPMKSVRGKRVVVSGFLSSTSQVSVTRSQKIQEIKESVRVHDISGQIAQKLHEQGVEAEAMDAAKSSSLRPDEVLVRGAVIAERDPGGATATLITIGTAGIFGCILPSPVPFVSGGRVTYRVEIIDADKRILLQTGEKQAFAEYKDYYMLGWGANGEKYKTEAASAVIEKIVTRLAGLMKKE